MADALKVVLIDEDGFARDAVERVIRSGYPSAVVATASSYKEAPQLLKRDRCDVVILDLVLGDPRSFALIQKVRDAGADIRILVLSASPEAALRSLGDGVNGFLRKDFAAVSGSLCEAISVLLAGGRFVSEPLDELPASRDSGALGVLSAQEVKVFHALAQGEPIKEISFALKLSEKTVRTYRARLLQKLHLKSNTDLIRFAILNDLL